MASLIHDATPGVHTITSDQRTTLTCCTYTCDLLYFSMYVQCLSLYTSICMLCLKHTLIPNALARQPVKSKLALFVGDTGKAM